MSTHTHRSNTPEQNQIRRDIKINDSLCDKEKNSSGKSVDNVFLFEKRTPEIFRLHTIRFDLCTNVNEQTSVLNAHDIIITHCLIICCFIFRCLCCVRNQMSRKVVIPFLKFILTSQTIRRPLKVLDSNPSSSEHARIYVRQFVFELYQFLSVFSIQLGISSSCRLVFFLFSSPQICLMILICYICFLLRVSAQ